MQHHFERKEIRKLYIRNEKDVLYDSRRVMIRYTLLIQLLYMKRYYGVVAR